MSQTAKQAQRLKKTTREGGKPKFRSKFASENAQIARIEGKGGKLNEPVREMAAHAKFTVKRFSGEEMSKNRNFLWFGFVEEKPPIESKKAD